MIVNALLDRRTLLRASAAGGFASLAAGRARAAGKPPGGAPIVETSQGKIRGSSIDGVEIFRGVPYAGPTEGAARFLPPGKPPRWAGVREATETGPRCVQGRGSLFTSPTIGEYFSGGRLDKFGLDQQKDSENCLVLNVLTPGLRGKRPVMLYIHGGGFTGGSGIIAQAADAFPRENDVVLLSVNHRLGVFGYLYLGDLSDRYPDSGNVGMLDLVAALRWVQGNIARFGGDPGNVTIFGESGGAAKISALAAMPSAKGLFHKAILQSGSSLRVASKDDATRRAQAVLAALGLADKQVAELARVPTDKLFEAGKQALRGAGPVVDGRSIPEQTWDPKAPELSAQVPMIIGTCKDEATLMVGDRDEATFKLDDAGLRDRVAKMGLPDGEGEKVIALYRAAEPKGTPSDIFFSIASDRTTRMDAITQAERKAQQAKAPVYTYSFTYAPPIQGGKYKALHTAELPLLLRLVKYPESETLSRQVSAAWAAFARKGVPDHAGLPAWPAYDTNRRATMVLGAQSCKVVDDPEREKRLRWASLPRAQRR